MFADYGISNFLHLASLISQTPKLIMEIDKDHFIVIFGGWGFQLKGGNLALSAF